MTEHHGRARGWSAWAVLVLGLLAAACPYQKTEPARPDDSQTPVRTLEPGQSVTVEFSSDGQWHAVPILLRNQETVEMRPGEGAAGFSEQAIRFQVGQVPQMLRPGERVLITMPGKLWFKVDRRFVTGPPGPVTVIVTRLK